MNPKTFPSIAQLTAGLTQFDAPFNEIAEDLQGWNSDHPIFDQLCAEHQPKIIVEVGSWKGRSAMHFAKAAPEATIFCVDTWLGGIDHFLSELPQDDRKLDRLGNPRLYELFLRNFIGKPEAAHIHPIRQTSVNAAKALRHHGVLADLIYIDGSHEYEDVYADLCAYYPLLAAGGRIFGDDFRGFYGLHIAVHRFACERGLRVQEVDQNFWVIR